MACFKRLLFTATLLFAFYLQSSVNAQINVEPFGFAISIEENAESEVELILSNSSENDVTFSLTYSLNNDVHRGGPRRDDLGDVIHEFDCPNGGADTQKVGVGWDSQNGWMWISNNPNSSVAAVDPNNDYQVARELNINLPWNVTCLNGHLYIVKNDLDGIFHYDTEGENLGDIDVGFTLSSITSSEELGLLFVMHDESRAFHVFTVQDDGEPDEQIAVIPNLAAFCDDNDRYRGSCWVDQHPNGQLWISNNDANEDGNGGHLYQIHIDTEEWEPVERAQDCHWWNNCSANRQRFGVGHDGENLWGTAYNSGTVRIIDDGIIEFNMLAFDPEEGTVQGNNSETVNVTVNTEGNDAGVYNILIEINLEELQNERDDLEETTIQISAVISVASPTSGISGVVTNASDNSPVENVFVELDQYSIGVNTGDDGDYAFNNLPLGEYILTFTADDFLPAIDTVNLGEDNIELNAALLHSTCEPSSNRFFMELEPNTEYGFEFQVANNGNGPLNWSVKRNLPEVQNCDVWELRSNYNAEDIVDDDMLNGAVCVDDYFYISGGNEGEDVNKVYILNRDFEQIGEFNQFAEDRYGMRDLAYDGNLIWGAVEGTFFGFTTAGNLETSFDHPVENLEGRCLAWDNESELLWASDISTDIYGINRNGERIRTVRNEDLRIYGLAYWQDDPDGYKLYVFCRGPDNIGILVYKVNLDNGDYVEVTYLDTGDSRPSGMQITNQFDVYSWVLIGLVQNPDVLDIWQLATNYEWFRIDHDEGVIEPNERENFVLTLDATDLPLNTNFEGELIFSHNGIGGQTILEVELSVVEGRVQTTRNIDLRLGWNTISTNLQPNDHENIEGLLATLVENQQLIMMKNGLGEFYRPEYEYNDIPGWYCCEGYQMLMASAATLTLEGESVLRDDPIALTEGWNLISYFPRFEIEATLALSGIADQLIIAKDGYGNFYLPEWDDFSNMGEMCAGRGYFVNVNTNIELVYAIEENERLINKSASNSPFTKVGKGVAVCQSDQIWISEVPRSSVSYCLLLLTEGMEAGTRLEAYTPSGELAGRGVVDGNERCGMALWGNESGFSDGEAITIVGEADISFCQFEMQWLDGDKSDWKADGWGVAKLTSTTKIPAEFGIVSAYPNPFNSQMRVSYNLLETGVVHLAAYDVAGRCVAALSSGRQVSGVHTVMFDGANMPSGVYMLRLQAGGQSSMMKVILLK